MDKRIGAQMFTIREHMKTIEDFDASCKKLCDIGYKIVQVSGTPLPANEMKDVLDKYGLKVVTTHRPYTEFLNNPEAVIEYNKTLGAEVCGLGMMPRTAVTDKKELDEMMLAIKRFCDVAKKENIKFGYHNHSVEFVKVDGITIMDRLIGETDPEVCTFIVDTYWVQNGGGNPEGFIRALGERAKIVHFKDYMVDPMEWQLKAPMMKEVGNGVLNWDGIIKACEDAGTEYALVEHDGNWINNDPFEALKVSYEYLTKKGFN